MTRAITFGRAPAGETHIHDCTRYLWKADPPEEYGYAQCSCGTWYRRGYFEFWAFLFSFGGRVLPRNGGFGCYWYRVSAPGCRPK